MGLFKIYGFIGIIAALLLIGGGITFVLTEDADQVIAKANEQYDNQNYDAAQKMYQSFIESLHREPILIVSSLTNDHDRTVQSCRVPSETRRSGCG